MYISKEIPPSDKENCCCCGTSEISLTRYKANDRVEHQHCELCFGSLIGNKCEYQRNYPEGYIVRDIAYMANLIPKAINGLSSK